MDILRARTRGHKITTIFGRKVTKHYNGQLQTVIEDLDLGNPATNNVTDYGVKKADSITDNYLDVQQDILETFVDRGQLRKSP